MKVAALLQEQSEGRQDLILESWINEEQGLPSQIVDMVDKILSSSLLERTWSHVGPETQHITFDMYPLVKDVRRNFIGPNSMLRLTIYNPDDDISKKKGYNGAYTGSDDSELDPETGTLSGANINFRFPFPRNNSIEQLRWFLRSPLSHELIHVYEDYNRRHLNRPDLFSAIRDRDYSNPENPDNLDQDLKYFAYVLDPAEQKAYIGETVADVKAVLAKLEKQGKLDKVRGYRTLDSFLQYTDFWGLYSTVRYWVENTQWDRMPVWRQKVLLQQYNQLVGGSGRAPKTYNDLVKKIQFRWSEFDKNLKTKVGQAVAHYLVKPVPTDPILPKNKLSESIFYQAF